MMNDGHEGAKTGSKCGILNKECWVYKGMATKARRHGGE